MGLIPNPRVTMVFHYGTTGWTESHYFTSAVSVTSPALYAAALQLIQNRVKCLDGVNGVVDAVKFSQDTINRDVAYLKRSDIPLPSGGRFSGGPGGPGWAWGSPHLSWPIKFLDSNQNEIAISYVAGMPKDGFASGPGPYDTTNAPPAGKYLDIYAGYLVAGPWGAQARQWPAGAFNPGSSTLGTSLPVWTAGVGPVPAEIVFGVPPVGMIGGDVKVGDFIRVGGLKYNSPQSRLRLNGTYQVIQTSPTTIVVNAPRVKANPNFLTFGYFQRATIGIASYQGYVLDNITHRKRGRVIVQPRGRAAAH